jgi:hypothetical protein
MIYRYIEAMLAAMRTEVLTTNKVVRAYGS